MAQCKLCWMHPNSNSKLSDASKSCNCASPQLSDEQVPTCHQNCGYYTKCKRAFEIGRFCNNFWDMPKKFSVSSVDHNAMRITKMIREDIINFVRSGTNLVIFSALPGNGKSLRATSLANTYISEIVKRSDNLLDCDKLVSYALIPKIVSDSELYDKLPYDNEERSFFYSYIQNLNLSDLVVWDEFGYNSNSRIETVTLRAIISCRLNQNKSNIFVINRSLEQLKTIVDNYDYNRIINSAVCVEFKGIDHRSVQSNYYGSNGGAVIG